MPKQDERCGKEGGACCSETGGEEACDEGRPGVVDGVGGEDDAEFDVCGAYFAGEAGFYGA